MRYQNAFTLKKDFYGDPNIDTPAKCVENLLDILNEYIADDELAEMHGAGCYGKGAKAQVWAMLNKKFVSNFLEVE